VEKYTANPRIQLDREHDIKERKCGESAALADSLITERLQDEIRKEEDPHSRWHQFHHLYRFAETVALCPSGSGKILDIGSSKFYGPVIEELRGYEVQGIATLAFNFEAQSYPFEDGEFDGALICEVIEHFTDDPMFCMNELNRIIKPNGFLLLTTPNAASWRSIDRALKHQQPSLWATYPNGGIGIYCIHAREYVVDDVIALIKGAGFALEKIFTRNYDPASSYEPIGRFPQEDRGEIIFCLARKISAPVARHIPELYDTGAPGPKPLSLLQRRFTRARDTGRHANGLRRLSRGTASVRQILRHARLHARDILDRLLNRSLTREDKRILRLLSERFRAHARPESVERKASFLGRCLEIVKLAPPGPAKVLDLGASDVYGPVLEALRNYSVEAVEGLAFNFEVDRYPFEDGTFDGAILCEVIQQYTDDPMFSLIELNRVVKTGGFLLFSTANAVSWPAIYRALNQRHPSQNPRYATNGLGAHNLYVREYLKSEVAALVEGAGFAVETLFTHNCDPDLSYEAIPGYDATDRGETIFCLARKVSDPIKRYVGGINGDDTPYAPTK